MDRVEVWDCEENLSKALVGVHLLRWIVTYPLDKVFFIFFFLFFFFIENITYKYKIKHANLRDKYIQGKLQDNV